ncbi:glycosyltransferase family protein [Neptuniibacter halophilus]|uniref:glycosyltransferase family protein n=1 Tax=Neptuniibacter halophilus TaxID=651666 RepID=UPI002573C3D1|nr:glycosyltransferase [Neptuniibacter halophilus]
MNKLDNCRLLIYSHDSFGLGHLRRCRTLAHALVDRYKGLSVLILTGSPIIGRFDFKARVDFVRIPGVIKLHNGEYTPLGLHIDLADTLALRESIILHTAQTFAPDLFLVDKEPTGLKGEVKSTLEMFANTPTRCVLGLRDVMDDPELLEREWQQKAVWPVLEELYDELWVYGPESLGSPLQGLSMEHKVADKLMYTGYLPRQLPEAIQPEALQLPQQPYILVTSGGGGDGVEMVDWVIRTYEQQSQPMPAFIVLGPFMPLADRTRFQQRAAQLAQVETLDFSENLEHLMANAHAVIAMGGYNTFCEILSFDRPALILPRSQPRREQLIRARKAQQLGLLNYLPLESERTAEQMHQAIQQLVEQAPPSAAAGCGLLSGLDFVTDRVGRLIGTEASQNSFLSQSPYRL